MSVSAAVDSFRALSRVRPVALLVLVAVVIGLGVAVWPESSTSGWRVELTE